MKIETNPPTIERRYVVTRFIVGQAKIITLRFAPRKTACVMDSRTDR